MASGQAKIELILELKNRLKAGLGSARSQMEGSIGGIKAKFAEMRSGMNEAFSGMTDQIPGLGSALSSLANPYALVAAGVVALGTAYVKASQMAIEWNKGMAKVNVTAQLSKKELGELSDQVMNIGANNATPLEDVPDAFNKVVSAGLNAKEALAAFDPILKGAKAGFTDLGIVSAATVATMNSTGIKDATKVLDVLFATMNKGNAEFADIANYLPNIIPMAEKAGQSFQDTAGAFAYLTAQGFKADKASTLLENTFKSLSDPKITAGFKKIGVSIYDSQGKARPMLNVLDQLRGKLKGMSEQAKNKIFATIGTDGESTAAIGALLKDYNKLKGIIAFTNNSQGQLNEAIKNSATPMDAWAIISNQVKMAMIEIGQTSLPMIQAMGTAIINTIAYWKDLYANSIMFRDALSVLGVFFEYLWNVGTMAISIIINGFQNLVSAISWVNEALGGSSGGFEAWYMTIKPYILWVFQYVKSIGSLLRGILTQDLSGIGESLKSFTNAKDIGQIKKEVTVEYANSKKPKAIEESPAAKALKENTQKIQKAAADKKLKDEQNKLAPGGGLDGKGKPAKPAGGLKDVAKATGEAQQNKSITINMDAMFKGDLITKNPQMANMGKNEMEAFLNDLFKRMIANLETSYS